MEHPLLSKIPGADAFCIALVLWPICTVPVVASEHFRPKTYPAIPQTVVLKDQERVASLRFTAGLPWSCDAVRFYASNLNHKQLEKLARMYRLTAEQKAEAMKCLKKENRA